MGSALVYVVVVALVAAVVYLAVSLVFGRGEEMAPMPPAATPTRLPARDLAGADVRALRFQQTLRGYKMSEVDWALERLAGEVDELRARLARLEGSPADGPPGDDRADPSPTDPTPAGPPPSGPLPRPGASGTPARGTPAPGTPARGTPAPGTPASGVRVRDPAGTGPDRQWDAQRSGVGPSAGPSEGGGRRGHT